MRVVAPEDPPVGQDVEVGDSGTGHPDSVWASASVCVFVSQFLTTKKRFKK